MTSHRNFARTGGVLLAIAFWSANASATSRLVYRAPAGCSTEGEFVAAVSSRGGKFEEAAAELEIEIAISEDTRGFHGTFRTTQGDRSSVPRRVSGATCSEVVDALAITTAIALRPDPEQAGDQISPKSTVQQSTPAPLSPTRPPRPPIKAVGSWPAPFRPGNKEIEVEKGTLRFESVSGVTALAGVAFGVVPGVPMPQIDISLSRANFVTTPSDTSYIAGPIWHVRLSLLADVSRPSGDLTTRVGGQSFGFGLCYSPLFDAGGFELLFCGDIDVGLIGVETRDASDDVVKRQTLALGRFGLGTEAVYNIGRHFHVALRLGAQAAPVPIAAERPDGSEIFKASWFSGQAMLGLGGHF